jgi:hypothetical protein
MDINPPVNSPTTSKSQRFIAGKNYYTEGGVNDLIRKLNNDIDRS